MPPAASRLSNDPISVSDECVQEVRALRVAAEGIATHLGEIVGFCQGASGKLKKYGIIALSVLAANGVFGAQLGSIIKQILAANGVG